MNDKRKNPWKACVGVVLLAVLIFGFCCYPDYDGTEQRAELLSSKAGTTVEIVSETAVDEYTVCQLRWDGGTGCGLFREFLGKTTFQWLRTTNSDRMFHSFESDSGLWLVLICDHPEVRQAVVHFYDAETGTYTESEPIEMEGGMLVIPHRPEDGAYDHTVYYDGDGNVI